MLSGVFLEGIILELGEFLFCFVLHAKREKEKIIVHVHGTS